ncbi:hypothetical protein FGG74_01715 [Escherichia coli]|nr:hypothetical protein FGG74_01715 [Escherichia coli]
MEYGTAFGITLQRPFQSINLPPNTTNSSKDLFLLFRSTGHFAPHHLHAIYGPSICRHDKRRERHIRRCLLKVAKCANSLTIADFFLKTLCY